MPFNIRIQLLVPLLCSSCFKSTVKSSRVTLTLTLALSLNLTLILTLTLTLDLYPYPYPHFHPNLTLHPRTAGDGAVRQAPGSPGAGVLRRGGAGVEVAWWGGRSSGEVGWGV